MNTNLIPSLQNLVGSISPCATIAEPSRHSTTQTHAPPTKATSMPAHRNGSSPCSPATTRENPQRKPAEPKRKRKESAYYCSNNGFDPWSQEDSHVLGQLRLDCQLTSTLELVNLEPVLHRGPHNRSPSTATKEYLYFTKLALSNGASATKNQINI